MRHTGSAPARIQTTRRTWHLGLNRGRPEKQVANRFAYLDAELHKQMQGLGLWLDTSRMSVAETVEVIIRCADEATLNPLS